MTNQALGLDEALVSVNGSVISKEIKSLDVLYRISECFGCHYEKIKTFNLSSIDDFIISTKHKLFIELRNPLDKSLICKYDNLNLNNHGHYKINIDFNDNNDNLANNLKGIQGKDGSDSIDYKCSMDIIDKGSCALCPLAMLITIVFLVTIGEKVFNRFLVNKRWSTIAGSQGNNCKFDSPLESRRRSGRRQQANESNSNELDNQTDSQQQQQTDPESPTSEDSPPNLQLNNGRQQNSASIINQKSKTLVNNDKASRRIDCLDAFRGITIAGMIMVNYGGAGYTILEHAAWDGITLADFVFPFFIFLMGASIAISTKSMMKRGLNFNQMLMKITRRSILLMLIGICLNSKWLDGKSLYYLRITGVLQRFSLSYLVIGFMFAVELTINEWFKAQSIYRLPFLSNALMGSFEFLTATNFLFIYTYVTFYYEYSPSCPVGYVGPGGETEGGKYANCTGGAAAWLDNVVLGANHIYNDTNMHQIFKTQVTHDPEGILGNTTSILLTLLGLQCGKILLRFKDHKKRLYLFFIWIAILAISCVNIIIIPINKRLWSLTFVTLTGCTAFVVITFLYLVMDVYKCERTLLLRMLISGGKNSIFLYVGHSLLSGMLPWYFAVNDSSHYQLLLRLIWATFLWLLVAHYMASKRLFIRL